MSEDQSKQQQLLEQPFNETALSKFRKEFRHDEFGRNKLKELRKARKFLIHVLKPEVKALLDIDKLEIDSESFVDEWLKSFYLDVLYRIPLKNSNEYLVIFILIELKTDNDQFTIFQILRYIINVWWREFTTAKDEGRLRTFLFPMVLPIIFYHGEGTFTAPVKMRDLVRVVKGLERYVLDLEAILFDVSALKSEEFPEDTELSVLFMTLQLVFSTDVAERLIEIYRKLRPTLHLPESQKELRDAIYYAATSAKHFSQQDFQKVSTQIEKEGVVTVSTSLLDQLLAESIAKGEAKGKAEGEARGEARGKAEFGRKAVLNVLCKRFKMTDVPSEIKAAIQQMNDSIALESLLSYALDCQTLDEFAETLY